MQFTTRGLVNDIISKKNSFNPILLKTGQTYCAIWSLDDVRSSYRWIRAEFSYRIRRHCHLCLRRRMNSCPAGWSLAPVCGIWLAGSGTRPEKR